MAKKITLIIALITSSLLAMSQQLNYFMIDSLTYKLYLQKDWKNLIKIGKEAERDGIDFYYLKLRMGVAYLELNRTFKATKYFEEAYKINPDYKFTQEYLYYSYLAAGLERQSLSLFAKHSDNLESDIKISDRAVKEMDVELSYFPTLAFDYLTKNDFLRDNNRIAYAELSRSLSIMKIGLDFQFSKKLFLYQNFEFTQNAFTLVKQSDMPENIGFNIDLNTYQLRSNSIFTLNLGHKFLLNANFNLISGSIQTIDTNLLYSRNPEPFIFKFSYKYFQFSSGVSLTKRLWLFDIKPHFDYFHTFMQDYFYSGMDLTFYPLGNIDLYLKTSVNYSLPSVSSYPNIITSEIGFRLRKIRFTGDYYYGNINNFVENDGYFVYNTPETITKLFGGGISFPLKNNKTFYLFVLPSELEYSFYNITPSDEKITYSGTFNRLIFKTGIIWKL